MAGESDPPTSDRGPLKRIPDRAARADANPGLVATARFIRSLLPGGDTQSDSLTASGQLRERLGTQLSNVTGERPSAMRELGLGALGAWQALTDAQRRRAGTADVAILFTDLEGFSTWALDAGDEAVIRLLDAVGAVEADAISDKGGIVVKRLGDGSMSVFEDPEAAVRAALDAQRGLEGVEVDGYTPRLRAGVHLGRPRKVGKDYLGVDVNIAARVGEAAKANQVLVSDSARERLDPGAFEFGRAKRLRAEGAPGDLAICTVTPRA
jgi:adenylate cyclase